MKKRLVIAAATVLGLSAMGALHAALDGLDMYDLGLSRTSVFDIPAPEASNTRRTSLAESVPCPAATRGRRRRSRTGSTPFCR